MSAQSMSHFSSAAMAFMAFSCIATGAASRVFGVNTMLLKGRLKPLVTPDCASSQTGAVADSGPLLERLEFGVDEDEKGPRSISCSATARKIFSLVRSLCTCSKRKNEARSPISIQQRPSRPTMAQMKMRKDKFNFRAMLPSA